MLRRLKIGLCLLLSLLLPAAGTAGCARAAAGQSVTWLDLFDTVTTVKAYNVDGERFAADAERLAREARQRAAALADALKIT